MASVEECLKTIIEKLQIESSHLIYLIPYPPTKTMRDRLKELTISEIRVTPNVFYEEMTKKRTKYAPV